LILKKLILQNIRSYRNQTIELSLGKTLFEGDIGSGKSTILMAIEFALFGLGSEKGASLLRTNESQGKVSLTFEIDGNEYTVIRELEKNKNKIRQIEGTLKNPNGVQHLPPSELKETILKILNFNEPSDPKAQSVIYRYAIFTPQEEMKTILFLKSDLRLQTLRKAFRIEDYKVAAENAKEITSTIKMKAKEFEIRSSDIQYLQNEIDDFTKRIASNQEKLEQLRKTEQEKQTLFEEINRKKDELHATELKLSKYSTEVSFLEKTIEDKKNDLKTSQEEIERLEKKRKNLEPEIKELEMIATRTEKNQKDLETEIIQLEEKVQDFRKIETEIDTKIKDYKILEENRNCPTCDRPADPKEYTEHIRKKKNQKEKASKNVEECVSLLTKTKKLLVKRRDYDLAQNQLKEKLKQINENIDEIKKQKHSMLTVKKQIADSQKKLRETKTKIQDIKEEEKKLENLQTEFNNVEQELREIRNNISSTRTTIAGLQEDLKKNEENIKKKKDYKRCAEILNEHQIWVEDYFVETLNAIEKHVMLNIHQDFNTYFQKWFSFLVDDPGKEARIDEEFTPIVEQDGYDQNIYYLSGGEKTSVALAYRLALNSIVQKVSTGMKSNLLILDEPTDGFSKHQLGKVRDILDELQSPQIVFVSHDKEVESFADQIFRVTKTQGESKVTRGA